MKNAMIALAAATTVSLSATVLVPSVYAQEETAVSEKISTASDRLVTLLKEEGESELQDVFAPAFLNAVPPAQFNAMTQQLTSQFGPVLRMKSLVPVNETTANIQIEFEKAIGNGVMSVNARCPISD